MWTSLNAHAIISVVGHFVSEEGKRRHVVLGLREIISEHTSENIAGVLIDLFRDYRITGNIGYFIANNTELNDTCIDVILHTLYPNMSAKIRKGRRLYYFGYITNLCAQAFIIRSDVEGVYKELATTYYKMDFKKIKELWRKRGAIKMLYNLI